MLASCVVRSKSGSIKRGLGGRRGASVCQDARGDAVRLAFARRYVPTPSWQSRYAACSMISAGERPTAMAVPAIMGSVPNYRTIFRSVALISARSVDRERASRRWAGRRHSSRSLPADYCAVGKHRHAPSSPLRHWSRAPAHRLHAARPAN